MFHAQRHFGAEQLMLHESQGLAQDMSLRLMRRHFQVRLFRQRTDPPNDLTRPSAVPDNPLERGVRFLHVGRFPIEPAQACFGVEHDGTERLIDLVSDRGSQLTQAGHARRVSKVSPGFVQLALGHPDRGDIHHRTDELNLACLIACCTGYDVDVFDSPIRHLQSIPVSEIPLVVRCALAHLPNVAQGPRGGPGKATVPRTE